MGWDGGCLFIGTASGRVPRHSHYAIQIALGSEPGVLLRSDESQPWTSYAAAGVPSRQPHSLDASTVRSWALLFVEPETREGRVLTQRYLQEGIAALPENALVDVAPDLFRVWREERTKHAVTRAARRVLSVLTGEMEPVAMSDERILRAVDYINHHLDQPLTLEDVAAEVFLSPSRFRHLFVEQTGAAFRPYVLWRRFIRVWALLMSGESLTTAAHAAGFADAAHLSRTSKQMFGFPPSAMPMGGFLRSP